MGIEPRRTGSRGFLRDVHSAQDAEKRLKCRAEQRIVFGLEMSLRYDLGELCRVLSRTRE